MQNDNDTLLTPDEVAEKLRINKRVLFREHLGNEPGKLAYIDLGHRTKRIRQSDLDAYLANCQGVGTQCN